MPHALSNLSLSERNALELAHDGKIPEQAIADMIAARGREVSAPVETVESLEKTIRWARNDLRHYTAQVDEYTREIAELAADGNGVYSIAEVGRKAKHLNYIQRQRAGVLETCGLYHSIIADASRKLADLQRDAA